MRHWKDKNFDKYFGDDEYDNDYDPEEDYENYLEEQELKEMKREGN